MSNRGVRIFRNERGLPAVASFADTDLPLDRVAECVEEPTVCRVETVDSKPKRRQYEDGTYLLQPNGSVFEESARISIGSMLGPRVLLHANVEISDAIVHSGVEIGVNTKVERDATIHTESKLGGGGLLGSNCAVGKWSNIGDGFSITMSTLGPKCEIGSNARIDRSRIDGNFTAGDNCKLTKATLSTDIKIGEDFIAGANFVVHGGSRFADYLRIGSDVRVAPRAVLGNFVYVDDTATIHDGVVVGAYSAIGSRTHLDVGVVLEEDSVVGKRVYVGPYIELGGVVDDEARIVSHKLPIPVWPIPKRTFEAMLSN